MAFELQAQSNLNCVYDPNCLHLTYHNVDSLFLEMVLRRSSGDPRGRNLLWQYYTNTHRNKFTNLSYKSDKFFTKR